MRDGANRTTPKNSKASGSSNARLVFRLAVVVLCLMLAGLQYRLWIGDGSFAQIHRLQDIHEDLKKANDRDRERNETLQARITHLKSDDKAAESRARSQMGMIKPGEKFFLTPSDDKKSDEPDAQVEDTDD